MTASLIAHLQYGILAPKKTLRIGGVDVSNYVEAGSVEVDEQGPGGVSSMRFTIIDFNSVVTFAESSTVEYWDVYHDVPIFRGWIQALDIGYLAVGRRIGVTCVGIEVLLDWMLIGKPLTIASGTYFASAIQKLVANATGVGWALRAFSKDSGDTTFFGSRDIPLGGYNPPWMGVFAGAPTTSYQLDFAGESLRDAIAAVITACADINSGLANIAHLCTVDFYGGLRTFMSMFYFAEGVITTIPPADYVNDTLDTGTNASNGLDFSIDASGVVREVYVRGATPAASGLISDGTGVVGPVAELADDTITTPAQRDAAGQTYLGTFTPNVRGTYRRENLLYDNSMIGVRPGGSSVYISADGVIVGNAMHLPIGGIRKTFFPTEDWDLSFGGLDRSAVRAQRRQTRATRS